MTNTTAIPRTPQVISAHEAYSVSEFRRRCGLGDFAWRQLRPQLPIVCIGKKRFIMGTAWLEYLARQSAEQQAS
jgi:hypothetical protein